MSTTIIYRIPSPYIDIRMLEVYSDSDSFQYEWRIISSEGHVCQDTGTENKGVGRIYGSAEIALRDALMAETGIGQ